MCPPAALVCLRPIFNRLFARVVLGFSTNGHGACYASRCALGLESAWTLSLPEWIDGSAGAGELVRSSPAAAAVSRATSLPRFAWTFLWRPDRELLAPVESRMYFCFETNYSRSEGVAVGGRLTQGLLEKRLIENSVGIERWVHFKSFLRHFLPSSGA